MSVLLRTVEHEAFARAHRAASALDIAKTLHYVKTWTFSPASTESPVSMEASKASGR